MTVASADQVTLREGEVEETTSPNSGAPVTVVHGTLEVGELSAGWYSVGVTHTPPGGPVHLPLLRLYIGDWTEGAGPDERWGVRIGISGEGPHLLDWSEDEQTEARPVFTPLGPAQILGTPMEGQVFTLVDLILTQDSRL